jgi:DNA polymerase III sliding clamp (beta) subunit (PCNA family)
MQSITINTIQLQALVNKANQCVGSNKFMKITSVVGIKADGDTLSLYTTDGTNTLCVSCDISQECDIDIAVNAETFVKLINKFTSDEVKLTATENSLEVVGNGRYTLALELDDDGNLLSFKDEFPEDADAVGSMTVSAIQTVQASLKSSLSQNAGSIYTNYYAGQFIGATDRAMMAMYDYAMFTSEDTQFLLNSDFVDLLALAGDAVGLSYNTEKQILLANAVNFKVMTKVAMGAGDFQVIGFEKMKSVEQDCYCKIHKKELLNVLDRLALCVGPYDDSAINIEFTNDSLQIHSLSSSGVEIIEYAESKNAKDKTIKININRLIAQLKSYTSDTVDLYYGSDLCIKLIDGEITQVIGLMR